MEGGVLVVEAKAGEVDMGAVKVRQAGSGGDLLELLVPCASDGQSFFQMRRRLVASGRNDHDATAGQDARAKLCTAGKRYMNEAAAAMGVARGQSER